MLLSHVCLIVGIILLSFTHTHTPTNHTAKCIRLEASFVCPPSTIIICYRCLFRISVAVDVQNARAASRVCVVFPPICMNVCVSVYVCVFVVTSSCQVALLVSVFRTHTSELLYFPLFSISFLAIFRPPTLSTPSHVRSKDQCEGSRCVIFTTLRCTHLYMYTLMCIKLDVSERSGCWRVRAWP